MRTFFIQDRKVWRWAAVCMIILLLGIWFIHHDRCAILTGSSDIRTEPLLVPGGQSVGIQMQVKGALIVGVENNAGPMIGDQIIAVNGEKICGPEEIMGMVEDSGEKVNLTVLRDGKKLSYRIKPYLDPESGRYRLGLWIKEKIAGIGTLSFYDPESGSFAALGHGIYDNETGILLENKRGVLLNTKVNKIQAGKSGVPGQLGGMLCNFQHPLGMIEKNTEFGIYGKAQKAMQKKSRPIPMGYKEDVKKGEAEILTTIEGTAVKAYKIRITQVHHQNKPDARGIEFEVTDPKLLEVCGGIVQGMSGSPILQNGKLIGAVTHVFLEDPTRGYGIFIENMLEEERAA